MPYGIDDRDRRGSSMHARDLKSRLCDWFGLGDTVAGDIQHGASTRSMFVDKLVFAAACELMRLAHGLRLRAAHCFLRRTGPT
jgi:hypothetical protein